MDFGIALLGRLVKFNRLDIQRYEQDTDITAGWETDMFLDTASQRCNFRLFFTDMGGLGLCHVQINN